MLNVDTAYYEFHCFDCSKPILQEFINKYSKKKTKVTDKNMHEIYETYDLIKTNEMSENYRTHPEKYKKTMDKIKKEFDKMAESTVSTGRKG